MCVCLTAILAAAMTHRAPAAATLSLEEPAGPFLPGQSVQVLVKMSGLVGQPAAGFQAFLEYDPAELSFFGGNYPPAPFGLQLISPIQATAGTIDLASGVHSLLGQTPTFADSTLATLTFVSISAGCRVDSLRFRAHEPPSRLTTLGGTSIVPLILTDSLSGSCAADIAPPRTGNTVVNVDDLLLVINTWGPCPPASSCCTGDIVQNAVVNVDDLLAVINTWGACP